MGQVVNPRHQTLQGQSVAKAGTPLSNILVGNVNMTKRSPKEKGSIPVLYHYLENISANENWIYVK